MGRQSVEFGVWLGVRLDHFHVEASSAVGDLMMVWRTVRLLINPVGAY